MRAREEKRRRRKKKLISMFLINNRVKNNISYLNEPSVCLERSLIQSGSQTMTCLIIDKIFLFFILKIMSV